MQVEVRAAEQHLRRLVADAARRDPVLHAEPLDGAVELGPPVEPRVDECRRRQVLEALEPYRVAVEVAAASLPAPVDRADSGQGERARRRDPLADQPDLDRVLGQALRVLAGAVDRVDAPEVAGRQIHLLARLLGEDRCLGERALEAGQQQRLDGEVRLGDRAAAAALVAGGDASLQARGQLGRLPDEVACGLGRLAQFHVAT
jgi:hypothetical protein